MLNNLPNFKNLMPEQYRDLVETSNKIAADYVYCVCETNVKFAQEFWSLWSKKNDTSSKN